MRATGVVIAVVIRPAAGPFIFCVTHHLAGMPGLLLIVMRGAGMMIAGSIVTGIETSAVIDVTGTGMIAMTGSAVMVTAVGTDAMMTELRVNH